MERNGMAEVEDKRIRRTKKLLRQALTRLMLQKDFQSITVTDVVREADINRGTFYAHYRDVYDLRDKIAERYADEHDGTYPDENYLTEENDRQFAVLYDSAEIATPESAA